MLIDLDVGDHRTGARSTEQALEIAEAIDRVQRTSICAACKGIQQKVRTWPDEEGERLVPQEAWAHAAEVRDAMARAKASQPKLYPEAAPEPGKSTPRIPK